MADPKPKAGRVPARKVASDQSSEVEKPQRERFIEAAEEAGVTDEAFDKALIKVAPPKKRTAP
jgi:hypothetical protein